MLKSKEKSFSFANFCKESKIKNHQVGTNTNKIVQENFSLFFFFDNFFKLKVLQKQQNERKENDLIAVPEK
jgi:hypothetical protein